MVKTLRAQNISLNDLVEEFGLEFIDDEQYFREWQDDLPELTDLEKQTLDGVKANFRHLSRYPVVEAILKLVVLFKISCWYIAIIVLVRYKRS